MLKWALVKYSQNMWRNQPIRFIDSGHLMPTPPMFLCINPEYIYYYNKNVAVYHPIFLSSMDSTLVIGPLHTYIYIPSQLPGEHTAWLCLQCHHCSVPLFTSLVWSGCRMTYVGLAQYDRLSWDLNPWPSDHRMRMVTNWHLSMIWLPYQCA